MQEDAEHRAVGRERVRHQAADAVVPRTTTEQPQQRGPDAAVLVSVLDDERNLGAVSNAQPDIPAHRDDVVVRVGGDIRGIGARCERAESASLLVGQLAMRPEIAIADGVLRQALMERSQG
jgi:hypothetical protein